METSVKTDLIRKIISQEKRYHLVFFGKTFNLTDFADTLRKYGEEKIKLWQNLGFEPHFLPKVSMMPKDYYPGWKIKPSKWFYKKVFEGKIFRQINGELKKVETVELEGISVLIDTRLKPKYDNGRQMYENDNLCGPVIEKLRESKKIASYEYGSQDSRFGISADEWESQIKLALAEELGLKSSQLHLEKTIETNVVPQIFFPIPRKNNNSAKTWCWCEEYFKNRDNQLIGGSSVSSGSAVSYLPLNGFWRSLSFRPLAVLN
ncbi:MAG: hypothetical protein AAB493_01805 [Patescibacteria group bacterium]